MAKEDELKEQIEQQAKRIRDLETGILHVGGDAMMFAERLEQAHPAQGFMARDNAIELLREIATHLRSLLPPSKEGH